MKKLFTLSLVLVALATLNAQVVTDSLGEHYLAGPSIWSFEPTEDFPLVLNENFQNWTLNHDKANVKWLPDTQRGRAAATSYTDWEQSITVKGQPAKINVVKCAVAPQGQTQNFLEFNPIDANDADLYKGGNNNYNSGQIPLPEDGVALSAGFLEVSRCNSNGTGANLSIEGAIHGTVTLPAIPGAVVIQYAYSSIGGSKRAFKLERSIDGGSTWEIVRNPLKNSVQMADRDSSRADVTYPSGAEATPTTYKPFKSGYFCSGAGVRVEDYIGDGEETVMLRFTINDCWKDASYRDLALAGTPDHAAGHQETQDYRIHDLRVIAYAGASGVKTPNADAFLLIPLSEYIATSVTADISIYDTNGRLVKEAKATNRLYTDNMPQGAYIVKAVSGKDTVTKKYIVK